MDPEKGSLVFERPCNIHHTPEPFLNFDNVDRMRVRHLPGLFDEPCRSSLGNAELVRAVEELEPDPRDNVSSCRLPP